MSVPAKDLDKCLKCAVNLIAVVYSKGKFAGYSYCPKCSEVIAGIDTLNACDSLTCSEVFYALKLAPFATPVAPPKLVRSSAAASSVLAAAAAAVPVPVPPKGSA